MERIGYTDRLRELDPMSAEWVTGVFLAVLVIMALINVSSPRKWRLLGNSMFSMRMGKQAIREEMDLQDRAFLGLMLVATAILALFGWQAFTLRGLGPVFPVLLAAVMGAVLGHYLFMRALSAVMHVSTGMQEYMYMGFLLFILSGLALLPVVVLIAYRAEWRPGLVIAGGVVLVTLLLYRWLRGAWIGVGEGVPLRYIILYFCAAELFPVLLVIDHWRNTLLPPFHS